MDDLRKITSAKSPYKGGIILRRSNFSEGSFPTIKVRKRDYADKPYKHPFAKLQIRGGNMTAVPPFIAWKMCWSKRRFKTFKAAKSNLKFLMTARRNKNRKLRVYFCPVCNNYHLTSQIDE